MKNHFLYIPGMKRAKDTDMNSWVSIHWYSLIEIRYYDKELETLAGMERIEIEASFSIQENISLFTHPGG